MRVLLLAGLLVARVASAQFLAPIAVDNFNKKFTPMLKPPAGAKVAVIVFEDLGCPSCAANHSMELYAVEATHVPLVRYDFPFPEHVWTFEGAVCARYIQDHISPKLAGDFRTEVFQSQRMFTRPEDIDKYLRSWLQKRNQPPPMVIDPGGKLAAEVGSDYEFGVHLNVQYTPTVIVVTKDKYQVVFGTKDGPNDTKRLVAIIQAAEKVSR